MERDAVLIMRFPTNVKAALRKAAENDHRTMSGLMLKLVSEYLASEGYLPASQSPSPKARKA